MQKSSVLSGGTTSISVGDLRVSNSGSVDPTRTVIVSAAVRPVEDKVTFNEIPL
jgi:hypothetical protein